MADGFEVKGWAEFVENCGKLADKWDAKKAELLKKMGNIYLEEVLPLVPVDTSRLVDSIFLSTEGIPDDYVEVGTNVHYAIYVDEGHVQHGKGGERYIPGVHFMDRGLTAAKPRLKRAAESFMEEIAREVQGGKK